MLQLLSNAFNDPSDPWYYVIGVLFLLLIFGALAVYVIWSGKKNKSKEEAEKINTDEKAEPKEQTDESANADTIAEPKAEPEKPEQSENKDNQ